MPIFRLSKELIFPPPYLAEDGLLAVGGDLRPDRLLLAYRSGIFPWYSEGQPILWHSPDPRMVLPLEKFHIARSLAKHMRKKPYEIRFDTAFDRVIAACAKTCRPGQDSTWITATMQKAYGKLFELGWAHCAEAWQGDQLVGGLYGVSIGAAFFGESMFAHKPDASKIAFATLVPWLAARDITLIDCQVYTEHLASFGAEEWPRDRFLRELSQAIAKPSHKGPWVTSPA